MSQTLPTTSPKSRYHWHIRGQVQGVGFRPFLFRTAAHAGVTGRVFNDAAGVHLEIQGTPEALQDFAAAYRRDLPPLARIESCAQSPMPLIPTERHFLILPTPADAPNITLDATVTIDTAVCPDCLAEMRNPANRRFRHAFINCTNCGPRYTILRGIPYDRPNTTMAQFPMCPRCRQEYIDPANRRFHAQPICCPNCGPQVQLVRIVHPHRGKGGGADGRAKPRVIAGDPFIRATELLLAGKILAIKGLGGFHLAVRADREESVARLRELKHRDAKPFALMCRDLDMARTLANFSPAGETELQSPQAPIVLAPRRNNTSSTLAPSIAPGTNLLGILLPYTPIHHLLWDALLAPGGNPRAEPPLALVMTSGNLSNEPLVIDNEDAVARLSGLCDAILWHNRPIERAIDDSIVRDRGITETVINYTHVHMSMPSSTHINECKYVNKPLPTPVGINPSTCVNMLSAAPDASTHRHMLPIRRSRGYVPSVFQSHLTPDATGLCVGGDLKNTIALVRDEKIIMQQHFGDLNDASAYVNYRKGIQDTLALCRATPTFVTHDLHPTYMSTRAAQEIAAQYHAPLIGIQHHAAHGFAIMGEHQLTHAYALICDGTGFGTDGTVWGGELLEIDGCKWRRLGRLRPMRLLGGDPAAKDSRRCALALLKSTYGNTSIPPEHIHRIYPDLRNNDISVYEHMLTTGLRSPWTSSTGRLCDAVAALLGLCTRNDHEAQAPMALEAAAWRADDVPMDAGEEALFDVRRVEHEQGALWELDMGPFVRWMLWQMGAGRSTDLLARDFFGALAQGWVALAMAAGGGEGVRRLPLVCSGGVFCNRMLERQVAYEAAGAGYCTFFHESYPPTDAGLAFGQAIFSQALLLTPR